MEIIFKDEQQVIPLYIYIASLDDVCIRKRKGLVKKLCVIIWVLFCPQIAASSSALLGMVKS